MCWDGPCVFLHKLRWQLALLISFHFLSSLKLIIGFTNFFFFYFLLSLIKTSLFLGPIDIKTKRVKNAGALNFTFFADDLSPPTSIGRFSFTPFRHIHLPSFCTMYFSTPSPRFSRGKGSPPSKLGMNKDQLVHQRTKALLQRCGNIWVHSFTNLIFCEEGADLFV